MANISQIKMALLSHFDILSHKTDLLPIYVPPPLTKGEQEGVVRKEGDHWEGD